MLPTGASRFDLDLGASVLIADKVSDIEAGRAAGVVLGSCCLMAVRRETQGIPSYQAESLDEIRARVFPDTKTSSGRNIS